jgi:hypothetical protein
MPMASHRDSELSGSSADVDPTGYDVDDRHSSSTYVDHAYSKDRSRRISTSGQSDKIIFSFPYQTGNKTLIFSNSKIE